METTRLASWNSDHLLHKRLDLEKNLRDLGVDICFICETKATPTSKAPTPRYIEWSPEPGTSNRAHYGVALWVGEGIPTDNIKIVGGVSGRSIWWIHRRVLFGGIYISPAATEGEIHALLQPPSITEPTLGTVIIGDLNGRHVSTGDRLTNAQGQMVMEKAIEIGLRLVQFSVDSDTYISPFGSSRVDWVLTSLHLENVPHAIIMDEKICGADHHLIYCTIKTEATKDHGGTSERLMTIESQKRLRHENLNATEWDQTLQIPVTAWLSQWTSKLKEVGTPRQTDLDDAENQLRSIVMKTAAELCGFACRRRNAGFALRSEELSRAKRDLRKEYKRLRKLYPHPQQIPERDWEQHNSLRMQIRHIVTKLKDAKNEERSEEFCKMSPMEKINCMTKLKKRHQRTPTKLGHSEAELSGYADYFQSIFRNNSAEEDRREVEEERGEVEEERGEVEEERGEAVEGMEITESEEDQSEIPFDQVDVMTSLSFLPKNKAPGPSGLGNELLRLNSPILTEAIYILFVGCWKANSIPKQWTKGTIIAVAKKGDVSLISNNRPITLTETMRKAYERVLLPELMYGIKNPANRIKLHPSQGGFRNNRSTLDQVAALQEAILLRKKKLKKQPVLAFLDIRAAFDTVWRARLWRKLQDKGIPNKTLKNLKALSDHNTSRINVNGHFSREIRHEQGVWQGTILSPLLYATFIDDLCEELTKAATWNKKGLGISSFLYADDIALIADDEEHLQRLLEICERHSTENRYKFAPEKCIVLSKEPMIEVTLYGQKLSRATHFPYLGVMFKAEGIDAKEHAHRRIEKAGKAGNLARSSGIGFLGAEAIGSVLRTVVIPTLEYGNCLTQPTKKSTKEMNSALTKIGKGMLGVSKTTSTLATMHWLDLTPMEIRMRELQAMWMRRIERLPDNDNYMVRVLKPETATGKSCFRMNVKTQSLHTALTAVNPISRQQTRTMMGAFRKEEQRESWEKEKTGQLASMDQDPGETRRLVYRTIRGFLAARRAVEMMALGRLIGRPSNCTTNGEKTSYRHAEICAGIDIRKELSLGDSWKAFEGILNYWERCKGLDCTKLRNKLARRRPP